MKIVKFTAIFLIALIVIAVLSYEKIISGVLLPQYIEWAHDTERNGLEIGIPLTERELHLATEIGILHPEKVRIVYVSEVPFPYENTVLKIFGEAVGLIGEGIVNNAQVFGYSIYVRNGFELDKPKLAHELVHVLQIERSTLDQVVTQHFFDMAEYGYDNAPLEVEAFGANKKYSAGW
ncbi:hypothetical protein [Alteromonas sp. KUL49]|uniref:hypothetical protein n=1 Tax=Alteromonas sp. KUL49 TaxID=2480798 RepID=UPI00102F21DF|nr:hypothetical protein [Alteromonas sp. KUL49]TAP40929.1 hypothetical protein EYS00_07430 [Alteromonas sp. KUL49]GEA11111.1 hypothetical protein KUL49_14860 [Alteromonas sp. KUL49]